MISMVVILEFYLISSENMDLSISNIALAPNLISSGCPTIQLNSDTTYQDVIQYPKRQVLCKTAETFNVKYMFQMCSSHLQFCLTNYKSGAFHKKSIRFSSLTRVSHRTQESVVLVINKQFIINVSSQMKYYIGQDPGVLSSGASVLGKLACTSHLEHQYQQPGNQVSLYIGSLLAIGRVIKSWLQSFSHCRSPD